MLSAIKKGSPNKKNRVKYENPEFSSFVSAREIAPYYGIRVLCMFLVAWFHIWQQSWLMPVIQVGTWRLDLTFMVRSGYIFVDGLILLSSFLLFLPYAKHQEAGTPLPSTKSFFQKRVARILPAYYFTIFFITVFVSLPLQRYISPGAGVKDVLMHMTFTHTFSRATYLYTPINGVLWTLAIEVQGYLLFPLMAKAFMKKPFLTYGGMVLFSFAYRFGIQQLFADTSMWFNQLPAFIDVYANGMAGAWILVALQKRGRNNKKEKLFFTALLAAALSLIVLFMKKQAAVTAGGEEIRLMQMDLRFPLTVVFSMLLVSLPFTFKAVKGVFGNKLMKFLAGISFNYYIWHQTLAVWLKKWGIPLSRSLEPHVMGDKPWQWQYTILCFALAVVVATVLTYGVERPLGKWITAKMKNADQKNAKQKEKIA